MPLTADLEFFLGGHREHGGLLPHFGPATANGCRLKVGCPCGLTFERWVTPLDAVEDILAHQLRADRN
jgi:hypothetical protein